MGLATLANVPHHDGKYAVQTVPMSEIYSDPEFNCRGHIIPLDVLDLAKDIKDRGLDQPIVIQPYPGHPPQKYRIVAGHRRHMAFQVNKDEAIPAFIRPDLDEVAARTLNLRENLHRKDLNIVQEARALNFFLSRGFSEQELVDTFGQSRGWVQVRKSLLRLPAEIQEVAASGILNQDHIKMLATLKHREDQEEFVRKVKDKRARGEKIKLTPTIKRPGDVMKSRERKKPEIEELSDIIYDILGPCLTTRFGAWCSGNISTLEFYASLERHCKDEGIDFAMPSFIRNAVAGIR
jgi:ParB/RepB/Spo0J family partition protein